MAQEQKFLNNCFFKEGKYGFKIALDPEALKNLKLVNGKYQIEAKKSRNGDKWYMVEDTWQPDGKFKGTSSATPYQSKFAENSLLPKDDVWSKAKDWQVKNQPNGDFTITTEDDSGLPFWLWK